MTDSAYGIKDAIHGAKKNTVKMLSHIQQFENRLELIEQQMGPIQSTTIKYSKAKENIHLTLIEVEKTYEFFRVAAESKETIAIGLKNRRYVEFFNAFDKLALAKSFFEEHKEIKSASSVLSNINSLLKQAQSTCIKEIESLLTKCGRVIGNSQGGFNIICPLSESDFNDLKYICNALDKTFPKIYIDVFRKYRISSLINQFRLYIQNENNLPDSGDLPYKQGTHPFITIYDFSFELIRGEYQFLLNVLQSGEDTLNLFIAIAAEIIEELRKYLEPFIQDSTSSNCDTTIASLTSGLLVRLDIFDIFSSKLEELKDLCRGDIKTENNAQCRVYELHVSIVDSCIRSLFSLITKSREFTYDSKSTWESCDLDPVTGNVLYCCKQLSGFATVYKRLVEFCVVQSKAVPPEGQSTSSLIMFLLNNLLEYIMRKADGFDNSKKISHRQLVSSLQFVQTNILALIQIVNTHSSFESGDKDAHTCLSFARRPLFLANNLYSFLVFLKEKKSENELIGRRTNIVDSQFLNFVACVEEKLEKSNVEFAEVIAISIGLTAEDMSSFKTSVDKDLSGKHRVLKAKFAMFNSGMEAFLLHQGEWRIPAEVLREHVTKLILDRIHPVYTSFFNTYSSVKFSKKHMDEYLRYQPDEVVRLLKSYFGIKL